jgi:hypothetical protein
MMKISLLIPVAVLLTLGGATQSAFAKPASAWPQLGVETRIVFPNFGAIRNFVANGQDGIWLEDQHRRWYYGEVFGGCLGLNYAQTIGFDTKGSSTFDRFSAIIVDGQECKLQSLVTAEKPLPRKTRLKIEKERKSGKNAAQEPTPN